MNFRDFLPSRDPNETIYIFVRPYFLSFLPTLALGVALIFFGILMLVVTAINFPDLVGSGLGHNIFVVIGTTYFLTLIPFFTVIFLDYYYDIHIVTDKRVIDIDQHGLFNREINELALEDVQDVSSYNKGILSSVFDFGNVEIETAGATPKFEFIGVRHPREIAAIILDLSEQAKQTLGGTETQRITPQGDVKAVINDVIYNSLDAMPPETVAPDQPERVETKSTATAPVPSNDTSPPEAPQDTNDQPESEPPALPSDDLDITIDDPSNSPPK